MSRKIILTCELCLSRNYHFIISDDVSRRLKMKKYCKNCNKHSLHKETK